MPGNDEGGWMGGNDGNGLTSYGYYQQVGDHSYHAWGSVDSTCENSPYWITTGGANIWTNGGTG